MGSVFGPVRFLLPVCRLSWFLYTLNIYPHFSSHFSQQLLMAEIWYLVTSFIYIGTPYRGKRFWTRQIPTSCLPTLLIFLHIEHIHCMLIFRRIFLSNYWWQKSDIWSQASYRYPISWEAFFDPSNSYFLFAEEQGYHRWALAHSSSCSFCILINWRGI